MLLAGCSMPQMDLTHATHLDAKYPTKGSIKIHQFEDVRPEEERTGGKTATNSLSAQTWSGATDPEMMIFLQHVLVEEAENTGLFTGEDQAEYEMSGSVLSMKVDRKVTIMRYLGFIPLLAGILASEPGEPYIWYGLAGSLVLSSLDFPALNATVHFQVELTKDGATVFEKEIQLTKKTKYWGVTEWSWSAVSNKASKVLDQAITESVEKLFEEIDAAISNPYGS